MSASAARHRLYPISLSFPRQIEHSPEQKLAGLLAALPARARPSPGAEVALLVGSRHIAGLPALARGLARWVKGCGARPFIAPAMGSHGNANPKGRHRILEGLGITEESMGVPVRCGGEPVLAGHTRGGVKIWADPVALAADAMIPVNRVKPHTAFRAAIESGPSKMLAVALGHRESARELHRRGLAAHIPEAARHHLDTGRVPLGVAVVENGYGETARVELLTPADWFERERALLKLAWELYPRLPFDELDLLIVERMGKDISGTGMDLNVIGMSRRYPGMESAPRIGRVVALDLTDASGGNATGVGYADVVTRKLAEKVDMDATRANCAASGFPGAARLPQVCADEEEAVGAALGALGDPEDPAIVRIGDTANLTGIMVTRAVLSRYKNLSPQQ